MVPRGLEPRTLRALAVRSNQLSYETVGFGGVCITLKRRKTFRAPRRVCLCGWRGDLRVLRFEMLRSAASGAPQVFDAARLASTRRHEPIGGSGSELLLTKASEHL